MNTPSVKCAWGREVPGLGRLASLGWEGSCSNRRHRALFYVFHVVIVTINSITWYYYTGMEY